MVTAYVAVNQLLHSHRDQIDLIGPVPGGGSWQAKCGQGFAVNCFAVNWETQTVTRPQGKTSQTGHPRREKYGHDYLKFRFAPADCHACACRLDCTQSKPGVRVVLLRPQAEYETLKAAREHLAEGLEALTQLNYQGQPNLLQRYVH